MSSRKLRFDRILFAAVVGLAVFGLVMVGSASLFSTLGGGGEHRFLVRQAAYAVIGLALMYGLMKVDYRRYNRPWVVASFVGLTFALLVLVLFTPQINEVHRWIRVGPIHIQPSEMAKLALALYLAYTLDKWGGQLADQPHGLLSLAGVSAALAGLVLIEPDTGTAVLLGLVTAVYLFLASVPMKLLGAMGGASCLVLGVFIACSPYRRGRVLTMLNPDSDPLGSAYQMNQALIALGSGGLTGVGLGQGRQKAYYLPFPFSDDIFPVIGEELGLLGTLGVLVLFAIVFWRGCRASLRAPDSFGMYLGLALTLTVVCQALCNLGVATALLPTKGLPLPFVSYGGSSLISMLAAMGVILNISQHSN